MKEKVYAEIGIGNESFLSTEFEKGDKEHRVKRFIKPKKINEYVSDKTTAFLKKQFHNYLFNKILQQFHSYEKFAIFLEMNKGTISAWKVRKNRIPLCIIKNMCKSLNIPFKKVIENIDETDREIAETI